MDTAGQDQRNDPCHGPLPLREEGKPDDRADGVEAGAEAEVPGRLDRLKARRAEAQLAVRPGGWFADRSCQRRYPEQAAPAAAGAWPLSGEPGLRDRRGPVQRFVSPGRPLRFWRRDGPARPSARGGHPRGSPRIDDQQLYGLGSGGHDPPRGTSPRGGDSVAGRGARRTQARGGLGAVGHQVPVAAARLGLLR